MKAIKRFLASKPVPCIIESEGELRVLIQMCFVDRLNALLPNKEVSKFLLKTSALQDWHLEAMVDEKNNVLSVRSMEEV